MRICILASRPLLEDQSALCLLSYQLQRTKFHLFDETVRLYFILLSFDFECSGLY